MDVYLFISFVFIISLIYYAIHLFFPEKWRLKYYISFGFGMIGLMGWTYVWLGNGWLTSAVVGTIFFLLSALSLLIAFLLDFIFRKKKGNVKG